MRIYIDEKDMRMEFTRKEDAMSQISLLLSQGFSFSVRRVNYNFIDDDGGYWNMIINNQEGDE